MKNFEKYINDIIEAINCGKCPMRKMEACSMDVGHCLDKFKAWAIKEADEREQETQKKWRPFKDRNEFIEEYKRRFSLACNTNEIPSMWIRAKTDSIALVTYMTDEEVKIGDILITWKELFKDFTFIDGSPCGVLEG